MKNKKVYTCSECDSQHPKWMGKCNNCGAWGSLVEEEIIAKEVKATKSVIHSSGDVYTMDSYKGSDDSRQVTSLAELDLVLGGGFVDSQVILFTGEPGIGKSTLLMQVVLNLANDGQDAIYMSGEESFSQVGSRMKRLATAGSKGVDKIKFVSGAGVEELLALVREDRPKVLVVDSIQTIYDEGLASLPGSLSQVKACSAALVRAAKELGFILLLVGHINKEGSVAGPKVLEHLVDTVLQFEGARDGEYRILRTLKNRFGSTGEVGMFVMTEAGLQDMDAGHSLFSGESGASIGAVKTLVFEGNRPVIVQVQALTNKTAFAYPKRVTEGLSVSRLNLVCAVLEKFAKVKLADQDVYIRTAGGYKLSDTSSDLALAAAIISSLKGKEVGSDKVFVGEVGLNGLISASRKLQASPGVLARLGVKEIVVAGGVKSAGKKAGVMVSNATSVSLLGKLL